jgi:hypothetical protein
MSTAITRSDVYYFLFLVLSSSFWSFHVARLLLAVVYSQLYVRHKPLRPQQYLVLGTGFKSHSKRTLVIPHTYGGEWNENHSNLRTIEQSFWTQSSPLQAILSGIVEVQASMSKLNPEPSSSSYLFRFFYTCWVVNVKSSGGNLEGHSRRSMTSRFTLKFMNWRWWADQRSAGQVYDDVLISDQQVLAKCVVMKSEEREPHLAGDLLCGLLDALRAALG